ncbi:two-component sensor histidine kinase, partial [Streptomyces sp. SID5926]|nr:two-component sensor histidine kinase [Streptomyces sp. SID5926]
VDLHNGEDAVIVLVSDAGTGIADPEAAMARGRGSGADGSTGLGLDIVRRMAESTGGDVRIGASVLGGTEVRIWIQLDGRTAPARRGHRGAVRRRRQSRAPAPAPAAPAGRDH